ncbi:MAG TPA: glycosyltransferase family 39 protein [Candidatus Polarisedimenticolia bacterium]|nr:glycosyltransferase family 39 protein [Candidatus Polarisedimenticolia bacterium]
MLLSLVLAGAGLRLAALSGHQAVDEAEGERLAAAAASHHSAPDTAPLHTAMLRAAARAWSADLHDAGQGISFAAGCGIIVLTFELARRLFGERAALLSAALSAFSPLLVAHSVRAVPEAVAGFLALAALLLADLRTGTVSRWGWAGLACALLLLVHPAGIAVAVCLAAAAVATPGSARSRAAAAGVFAGCFAAVVMAWASASARSPEALLAVKQRLATVGPASGSAAAGQGPMALPDLAGRLAGVAGDLLLADHAAFDLVGLLFPAALAVSWRAPRLRPGHMSAVACSALLLVVPPGGQMAAASAPLRAWIHLAVAGTLMHCLADVLWRRRLEEAGRRSEAERGGPAGAFVMSTEPARRFAGAVTATLVAVVVLLSMGHLRAAAVPAGSGLDRACREAADWIRSESESSARVLDDGTLRPYSFLLDRPILPVPDAPEDAVEVANALIVVTAALPAARPGWRRHIEASAGWLTVSPPPGFREAFRSSGGEILILESDHQEEAE